MTTSLNINILLIIIFIGSRYRFYFLHIYLKMHFFLKAGFLHKEAHPDANHKTLYKNISLNKNYNIRNNKIEILSKNVQYSNIKYK